ncbi:hypothetical protein EV421DRAFT_1963393 [Armillaria borealis]|uniref:Uncharacterized protein n=1 Tax=Armillaria borealis TaxID=47425 RepID=A0AA39MMF4_9AGAR|nr:hypothetical protein EV421DRAFT_1963393 [Armillaria borealis]
MLLFEGQHARNGETIRGQGLCHLNHGDVSPLKANIVHGFREHTDTLETHQLSSAIGGIEQASESSICIGRVPAIQTTKLLRRLINVLKLTMPRRRGSKSTGLSFIGRIHGVEGSLPNEETISLNEDGSEREAAMFVTAIHVRHARRNTLRTLPPSKLDSVKGRSVGGIMTLDRNKGLPSLTSEGSDSNNEYNLICDNAALAVKVSTEVMRNPDASERVDESSLRRPSKTAGQGVDTPTTTINTGIMLSLQYEYVFLSHRPFGCLRPLQNVKFINNPARPMLFSLIRPERGPGRNFRMFGSWILHNILVKVYGNYS